MKNVQIRNVPDETHATLRKRAAKVGMSLQEYLLGEMKLLAGKPTVMDVMERAAGRTGGRVPFDISVERLRADRDGH